MLNISRDDFVIDENGYITSSPFKNGTNFYAAFENGATVMFNTDGGTLGGLSKWVEEISEVDGKWNINLADFVPEREGYSFLGWNADSSAANTQVIDAFDSDSTDSALRELQAQSVNGGTNYTLYAKWKNSNGDDFIFDNKTGKLTVNNDRGMSLISESLSEEQIKSVKSIEIAEGIKELKQDFDYSMFSVLEEVSIPSTVTRIYGETFSNCSKLKTVNFADTDEKIDMWKNGLTIDTDAFKNCAIEELRFPRRLCRLRSLVFEGCPLGDVYFQDAEFSGSEYIYHRYRQ